MPETATRLPRARSTRNPAWLEALDVYKRSFDATSAETLIEGAEAFAEMSPDNQAFHQGASRRALPRGSGPGLRSLRALSARRLRRRSLRVAFGDQLSPSGPPDGVRGSATSTPCSVASTQGDRRRSRGPGKGRTANNGGLSPRPPPEPGRKGRA